jgi:SAM-dependent methyltransferase
MDRMTHNKVKCSEVARKFDNDFFDGKRIYGYGGYKDDGRWKEVAIKLVYKYKLNKKSKIFDIGCGKGFLARDIENYCGCTAWGGEVSHYCLANSVLDHPMYFRAGKDKIELNFDLIISLNSLHNLVLPELKQAIQEINKHSKNAYIVVESYRSVQELHNLQCWAMTCEQFFRPEEWEFLFNEWGYKGDYEFIFFE